MKNHWLDQKKNRNRWKRVELRSTYGTYLIMSDLDWDCEKSNETLQKWEANWKFTFDLTEDAPKQVKH